MNYSAGGLKRLLNIYGPYLGAGVRVTHVANDFREIRVSMKLRWYNRNVVGTHFGGSLYSMVDPHLMLMLMKPNKYFTPAKMERKYPCSLFTKKV